MADKFASILDRFPIEIGRCVDFGHCYAELAMTIDGRVGVKIHPEGHGVLSADECDRLGKFLSQQAHAICIDATRRKDSFGNTLPRGMLVYVISDGNGLFKIGKATDVAVRIKQLQTGNGRRLQLIAFCMCEDEQSAYLLESSAHRALSKRRSCGEWFDCHHVDALNALYAAIASTGAGGAVRVLKEFMTEAKDGRAQG